MRAAPFGFIGIHRIRLSRLRCRDPRLNERLAVWSDRENDPQILEHVRRLRIERSIRIDALDIDDVLAVGMAADEIVLLLHVGDDAVDPLAARLDFGQELMRAQQRGRDVLGEALGRGEAVQLTELGDRPSRRRTHEAVRRRIEIAEVRQDLLRFENKIRPFAGERIEGDRRALELTERTRARSDDLAGRRFAHAEARRLDLLLHEVGQPFAVGDGDVAARGEHELVRARRPHLRDQLAERNCLVVTQEMLRARETLVMGEIDVPGSVVVADVWNRPACP